MSDAYTHPPVNYGDHWSQVSLRGLAEIEPGWATSDELSWNVFHSRGVIRGKTRAVLRKLGEDRILERFDVRHRGDVQDCYRLDPDAIRKLLK